MQVTRSAVLSVPAKEYLVEGVKLPARKLTSVISFLNENGYCASERALADIGYAPARANDNEGNKQWVIILK